jgi:hypothetical protein
VSARCSKLASVVVALPAGEVQHPLRVMTQTACGHDGVLAARDVRHTRIPAHTQPSLIFTCPHFPASCGRRKGKAVIAKVALIELSYKLWAEPVRACVSANE